MPFWKNWILRRKENGEVVLRTPLFAACLYGWHVVSFYFWPVGWNVETTEDHYRWSV